MIRVALAGVDQEHLSDPDLTRSHAVIEPEAPAGHYQCDRYGVAVLRHGLARVKAQPDHAHRPAIGDLLEAERARAFARLGPRIGTWH